MRATRVIRLCLLFSWGLGLMLGLLLAGVKTPQAAAYAPPSVGEAMPNASFHFWQINEIFSCPDGSIQFVEMTTNSTGQEFLQTHELRATSGAQTESFIFPNNSPNYTTTPKSLLIATAGFGSLSGGVTPDFILPPNFIFTTGSGSVELVGAATTPISYSSGGLPLDGKTSLGQSGATGVNSPRNFAGQQGSISCTPNLTLSKTADASGIVETGSLLTYTLAVANQGLAAATNGILTDTIPVSTTYVPNSASNGGGFAGGVVSWTNLTITPGTTITRTFQVTVSATITTGNKITNTAHITSAQGKGAAGSVVVTGGSQTGNKIYLPLILKN
jgi:uncharacterized repeat protein (TIGR01451 family)